jgi:putative hydrolase of HD superfamily
LVLIPSLKTDVRLDRVVEMLLVHDIGEIDAGDTFLFAEISREEQKVPELAAVTRIFGLAPAETGARLLELWKEFEFGESVEARLARAIDRSMPALLNLRNGGGTWREYGISYERVVARIEPEIRDICPELWAVLESSLQTAKDLGHFST